MNEILTYILGGGFVSALMGILTLRTRVRKIHAETESLNLYNSEKAIEILMNNIVEPLKQELYETRKEMALLRAAILSARQCRYADDCPVLAKMREQKTDLPSDRAICAGINDDLHAGAASGRGSAVAPD